MKSVRLSRGSGVTRASGVVLAVIVIVAGLLRLSPVGWAYDVFHDEVIYTRIADGFALDGRIRFGDHPFLLHGPLSFVLQGVVIKVLGIDGTAIEVVHAMRTFNAAIAAFVAALLAVAIARVTDIRYGVAAAAVFAFDPFIVKFDSRAFLETTATFWLIAGFVLLVGLAGRQTGGLRRAAAAGLLFGFAMLTKETSAPLYGVPLLWCLGTGAPVRRGLAFVTGGVAAAVYSVYPLIAVIGGDGGALVDQKLDGVLRLIGVNQETGFNKTGVPSFASRLVANLPTFGGTYVLIGLGFFSMLYVLKKGTAAQRVLGLWAAGAFLLLGFQMVQGTLEEQMFYWLVVPSVVVGVIALSRLLASPRRVTFRQSGLAVAAVAYLTFASVAWVIVHTRNDDAVVRTVGWIEANVPAGTRIAPLVDGTQYLLPRYRLLFDPEDSVDVTPEAIRASRAELVLTSSVQVNQGYSTARPALVQWLRTNAVVRYRTSAPTAGTVLIWQVTAPPQAAPPGPQELRPRAPLSVGAR